MRRSAIPLSFMLVAFSACSGGQPPAPAPGSANVPFTRVGPVATGRQVLPQTVDTNGAEWPEFRRDDQRTGNNPYQTKITAANVGTLKPKWTKTTNGVFASAVVKNGVIYEGDVTGNLFAWNLTTGAQKWAFTGAGAFISTPYYYNGTLYVASDRNAADTISSEVYSINATTGAQKWAYKVPNFHATQSSPLVANGLLYEGTADKDENLNECDANHQLIALQLGAPKLVSALNLSPAGLTGADIWASPMLDTSGNIYVATGNECTTTTVPFQYANSIIRVDPTSPTMGVTWAFQSLNGPGNDEDFGGTPIYVNGMVVETGKDGYTYALNPATGAVIWDTQTGAAIGSSSTDGTHVFIPTEPVPANSCAPGAACGAFEAVNLSDGSIAWSIPTVQQNYQFADIAAPAVSNGVVYAAFNGSIWALNASTGATLWSYATPSTIVFAGLTIVNGGLLVGEYTSGSTFFCFTPGGK